MAEADCPNCGQDIGIPGMFHGSDSMTMHTHQECPGCGRPLIWFKEGDLATGWRIDEAEERQRKRRNED